MAPCTTSTVRGRSLKLSNYSGNVMYMPWFADRGCVHVALMVKKVDCNTSILDEDTPTIVMDP